MNIIREFPIQFSQLKTGDCFYSVGNPHTLYMKIPTFDDKAIGEVNAINLESIGYKRFDYEWHVFPIEAEIHTKY